jgi:PAS domain-containing protein
VIAEGVLQSLKHLSGALLDAWVVVDRQQQVLDFNPLFRGLFPRGVARQLKRSRFPEVLRLELGGQPLDVVAECIQRETPLRYDEVLGRVAEDDVALALIVSAAPLVAPTGTVEGTFLTLRNVTDEAQVQVKYKSVLEAEARERELLQRRIVNTEAALVDVKDQLATVERELLDYKKGLLV